MAYNPHNFNPYRPLEQIPTQKNLIQFTGESMESLVQDPSDPNKVIRYLLSDKTNQMYLSNQNTQKIDKQQILNGTNQQHFLNTYNHHSKQQNFSNRSFIMDKENQVPIGTNTYVDVSKSADLAASKILSPKTLIESCLTFNGDQMDKEMNFLETAMQPDKIFDLPMALVKVQKAFQQSNMNAIKLKESLELVLSRESQLQEKYNRLKKEHQLDQVRYEEELVKAKQQLKEQLQEFSGTIQQQQTQIQERDKALHRLKEQLTQLYKNNQDLRETLDLKEDKLRLMENEKQQMQGVVNRKQTTLDELQEQFEILRRAEEISSKEIDKLNTRSKKEIQYLKSQLEEKQLLVEVLSKDLDCLRQEKKLMADQESRLQHELMKARVNYREDSDNKYVELLAQYKEKELEVSQLTIELNKRVNRAQETERKYQKVQEQKEALEEDLRKIQVEIGKLNDLNREALSKQRGQYEQRMKEMEEEVTKLSLTRYKTELEQKQKFLKHTKRYDEQVQELKSVVGCIVGKLGVKSIPDYLLDQSQQTICEVIVSRDMQKMLDEISHRLESFATNKSQSSEMTKLKKQYDQLLQAYKTELMMRRGLHNKLQEMKGNIRVLCRVRPMLNHEQKYRKKQSMPIKKMNTQKLVIANESGMKEQTFNFDKIFAPSESQSEIFEEVQQLVISCLDGFNVCIMAYGQTGSGKTYTMIGTDENPGLYFYSMEELFDKIGQRKKLIDYEIGVSFVEIYNENLRELLSTKKGHQPGNPIKLRENAGGETTSDQIIKPVKFKNQVLQYLKEACLNRTVGQTHYNEQSSRSHFIFTIHVTGYHRETKQVFKGKLNLIDLAGSERILKSHAEGDRIKEALNINQSLTTLGKVFLALLNKQAHVPYRDSKLTHYLKDSLGGESKTMLIVQISPSPQDYGESVSSLSFGQRVSCIEKGQIRATIESPQQQVKRDLTPSDFMRKKGGKQTRHDKSVKLETEQYEMQETAVGNIFSNNLGTADDSDLSLDQDDI